jgi:broad specificity phosphatase PhoE
VSLNENGINQSILAGKALCNTLFDVIYSSDLNRAFETATKVVEKSNVLKQPVDIIPEVLLREMSHGKFENGPSSKMREAALAAGFSQEDRRKFRPPGGENEDDVALRAKQFLSKLIQEECTKENHASNILIVSHGLLLRELYKTILEKETSKLETKEGWNTILKSSTGPNTGISNFHLQIDKRNCELLSTKCLLFASDAHLKTEIESDVI